MQKTKPILVERFADNGEHSHWDLIDPETNNTLWYGHPDERPTSILDINEKMFPSDLRERLEAAELYTYKDYRDSPYSEDLYSPYTVTEEENIGLFTPMEIKILKGIFRRCEDKDCSYFRFII